MPRDVLRSRAYSEEYKKRPDITSQLVSFYDFGGFFYESRFTTEGFIFPEEGLIRVLKQNKGNDVIDSASRESLSLTNLAQETEFISKIVAPVQGKPITLVFLVPHFDNKESSLRILKENYLRYEIYELKTSHGRKIQDYR